MTQSVSLDDRLRWWREARSGLFVHWGCYAVLGRGEQIMSRDVMPLAEYEPIAAAFRPKEGWAERLAQSAVDAGARYMVLTTRHHDGYCLFDTTCHDFSAPKTGPGRDLVAEYVTAARAAGLKVGFYYSIMNWRWPGFWDAASHPDDLPRMVDEVHTQVGELMTGYGPIDILWYDVSAVPGQRSPSPWGGEPVDEDAGRFWRMAELNARVRKIQPGILINNRGGLPEDFGTPEQRVSSEGQGRAWETCMTVNYAPGWGYLTHSSANKTAAEVLYNLLDAVRLGGNMLFNVGPKADGSIDGREAGVLREVGRWMARYGEAVYGTAPESIYDLNQQRVQGPVYHYGMWTCKGSTAYLTVFRYPGRELVISRVGPAVLSARLLATGEGLAVEPLSNSRWLIKGLPDDPPDPLATVIQVEFAGPPYALETTGAEWLTGGFA